MDEPSDEHPVADPAEEERPDRRRVVLHPKTALARRHDRARSFGGHVRGYTVETDDVLRLLHAQRRLSLMLVLGLFAPVASLPLLFEFFPATRT